MAKEHDGAIQPPRRWGGDVWLTLLNHGLGLIGLLVYAACSPKPSVTRCQLLGIVLLLALAASAFGALLGFLFGIPHALQQVAAPSSGGAAGAASSSGQPQDPNTVKQLQYSQSTNLEQISDWITKIVVGVTLTQLTALPAKYKALAEMYPDAGTPGTVIAIVLYFQIAGFLSSWLLTRLRLLKQFVESDAAAASVKLKYVAQLNSLDLAIAPDPGASVPIPADAQQAVDKLASQRLEDQKSVAELVAWAKARFAKNDFTAAAMGYRKALEMDPANGAVREELGAALSRLKDPENAIRELTEALNLATDGQPESRLRITKGLIFNYLYEPDPDGFTKAIAAAESYLAQRASTTVLVYLACAYAQKYAWRSAGLAASDEMWALRTKVLDSVRKALARPDAGKWRATLRRLLHPSVADDAAGENDLKMFSGDSEFEALLGPSAP